MSWDYLPYLNTWQDYIDMLEEAAIREEPTDE